MKTPRHSLLPLVLLALALVGAPACSRDKCTPLQKFEGWTTCIHECTTSKDCADGLVCVHEHAHDLLLDTCEAPCTYSDAGTPSFSCPDSPLGTACTTDDGQPFCPPLKPNGNG